MRAVVVFFESSQKSLAEQNLRISRNKHDTYALQLAADHEAREKCGLAPQAVIRAPARVAGA